MQRLSFGSRPSLGRRIVRYFAFFAGVWLIMSNVVVADDTDPRLDVRITVGPPDKYGPVLKFFVTNASHEEQSFILSRDIVLESVKDMSTGDRIAFDRDAACPPQYPRGPMVAPPRKDPRKFVISLAPGATHAFTADALLCGMIFTRGESYEGYGIMVGSIATSVDAFEAFGAPEMPLIDLTAKWQFVAQ